jgi:hypothetical protein
MAEPSFCVTNRKQPRAAFGPGLPTWEAQEAVGDLGDTGSDANAKHYLPEYQLRQQSQIRRLPRAVRHALVTPRSPAAWRP